MKLNKLLLLIFLTAISGCLSMPENNILDIVYVMEHKDELHNQYIQVKGDTYRSFESCTITPKDTSKLKLKGSMDYELWFNEKDKGCYAGEIKYGTAVVEGYFDKNGTGHLWSYKASLNDAIITWSDDVKKRPYP